jgi:MFS family permease
VTVEPVVFLYTLGTYLYFPLYQQYYYLRYGIDQLEETNFTLPNSSFCLNRIEIDEYGGNGTYKIVEKLSDNLLTYGSLCNRVMSLIATLIMGPLSDKYGRRLVIIIVATGMLLQGIISLFIVHYHLSLYFFLVTQAIAGITGDFAAILMACFTYVVDVSSVRYRTLRIAIAEAMLFFAGAIGEGLISGFWLQKLNCYFIPPIWLFIACALGIIGYTIVFLPESLSSSKSQKQARKKQSKCQSLVTGIKILFGQYKGLAVWKLWCGLFVVFIVVFNMAGAVLININYFKARLSLDWDPETTGFYLALQQLSNMAALLVILPLFIACKLPDALISIFGVVAHCIINVVVGLASVTYQFFIGK